MERARKLPQLTTLQALFLLQTGGPTPLSQVRESLLSSRYRKHFEGQTVYRIADRLEGAGLINKRKSGRAAIVTLTSKGVKEKLLWLQMAEWAVSQ